ncbi:beta-carotene 15,15'-monooxygenase, Brp/Blh family [Blastococcus aurantiacus]|uniref:Probable beta-carotene 15,15'-dioxygenase n=1 Tax=Blastococcus aurantiacus TaxID=1550231 RepID=A0A1G7HY83_9ACTN|nr:Brp/Blh family beta-carotene 15,15'-dioxygenase [Blastococcus aurantiacus]SDF05481.1 beta-carotene 15,15'-monooxygenase, Brp/Blh family [Blastococcus aurantiacus]
MAGRCTTRADRAGARPGGARLDEPSAEHAGAPRDLIAVPAALATAVSTTGVAAVLAVEVLVPGGWGAAAWVPLVAGLLLGLPHGAVDHLLPSYRLHWRPVGLLAFAAGYAALAALAWAVFTAAPGPGLLVFVLVSAWHFGTGETAFADLRAGGVPVPRPIAASVLGALVLLVPLARGSSEVAAISAAVVPGWDGQLPGAVRVAVLAVVLPAAVLLAGVSAARRRWLEAGEVLLLLALVLVVPPAAAFGTWFGTWHAVRHVARVVAEDPAGAADLRAGRLAPSLRRFAVAAAAPTVAVLVVLTLLWSAADGWRGFVAAYLPLLAALTVPHVLVVAWLDRSAAQAGSRRMGTCGMPSST